MAAKDHYILIFGPSLGHPFSMRTRRTVLVASREPTRFALRIRDLACTVAEACHPDVSPFASDVDVSALRLLRTCTRVARQKYGRMNPSPQWLPRRDWGDYRIPASLRARRTRSRHALADRWATQSRENVGTVTHMRGPIVVS